MATLDGDSDVKERIEIESGEPAVYWNYVLACLTGIGTRLMQHVTPPARRVLSRSVSEPQAIIKNGIFVRF